MLAINPQSKVEGIGFVSLKLRLASPSGTLWFAASLGKTAESSLPIPHHPFPVGLPLPFSETPSLGRWMLEASGEVPGTQASNTPRFLFVQVPCIDRTRS